MACDELVSGFRDLRESRNVIVTPRQPCSRRPILQRTIDGFRRKKCFAIWLDESHGVLELIDWNFGKQIRCPSAPLPRPPELRRCVGRDFFRMRASDNPTSYKVRLPCDGFEACPVSQGCIILETPRVRPPTP